MTSSSTDSPAGSRRHARGFTLVEALVAFTVTVLLLFVLQRVFTGGIGRDRHTTSYGEATILAESTLESAGADIPLAAGAHITQRIGRFDVDASVAPYEIADNPAAQALNLVPYEIRVTVSWREGGRRQSLSLRTLRLGAAEPP
jgi:general secretion pathway protein I